MLLLDNTRAFERGKRGGRANDLEGRNGGVRPDPEGSSDCSGVRVMGISLSFSVR